MKHDHKDARSDGQTNGPHKSMMHPALFWLKKQENAENLNTNKLINE